MRTFQERHLNCILVVSTAKFYTVISQSEKGKVPEMRKDLYSIQQQRYKNVLISFEGCHELHIWCLSCFDEHSGVLTFYICGFITNPLKLKMIFKLTDRPQWLSPFATVNIFSSPEGFWLQLSVLMQQSLACNAVRTSPSLWFSDLWFWIACRRSRIKRGGTCNTVMHVTERVPPLLAWRCDDLPRLCVRTSFPIRRRGTTASKQCDSSSEHSRYFKAVVKPATKFEALWDASEPLASTQICQETDLICSLRVRPIKDDADIISRRKTRHLWTLLQSTMWRQRRFLNSYTDV